MDTNICKKLAEFVSAAKKECKLISKKINGKDIVEHIKDFKDIDCENFIKGSLAGLDICLKFDHLEAYEKFIINYSRIEEQILDDIKNDYRINSLKREWEINKAKVKLLNQVKGMRHAVEFVYMFLVQIMDANKSEEK